MEFKLNGTIRPSELVRVVRPIMETLEREGITAVEEISLGFRAWRGDVRVQMVDQRGFIATLDINAEDIVARKRKPQITLPSSLRMRDRPDELDNEILAVFVGRDD